MHPQSAAFERALAFHCAPALSGAAPANLVSLARSEYPDLPALLARYGRRLEPLGIRLFPLCQCDRRWLLLVFRPALLRQALALVQVRACLLRCGYPAGGTLAEQLELLRDRVSHGGGFPHEIGFFLGYPLADVLGFLALGGECCRMSGYWKVYGDVAYARGCFARFDRCRDRLCRGLADGTPLLELLQTQRAQAA
ncbi:DUF3793 family protein [Clostridium sp. J1101437_171009_A5]|uniref:DUF3793 family protein n=1 Tax=Clostridium sp. J1101437_171009_A5 TaxID=2787098 RepID=UPI00189AFB8E|nr:DUF3793 family protein [Clostridium sp. J1101437_171009_A5]